ncbi:MAG: Nif3-like dinuclear metal center hexameric protein [Ruthenibacterium sp.]
MLIKEVVEKILVKSGAPRLELSKTCDLLIIGDENAQVKKIATTFMATVEVINEAARQGVNFIITHEPTWFTGADNAEWAQNDPVYQKKKELIEKNHITIWRYHDHMHMGTYDGIYTGMDKELGWSNYQMTEDLPYLFGNQMKGCYKIPKTTLRELALNLKSIFEMDVVQIVGNANMPVERVGILVGGGSLGLGVEQMPMQVMHDASLDVLICGDIIEWTLPAYVRDAAALAINKGMLVLGHERSEEAGMKHLPTWLESITEEIPVVFIDAKEPFKYIY